MNLPQLPQDKANHFFYGALIAMLCVLVLKPVVAMAVVVAVGALKELSDWLINQRAISDGLLPPHGVELLDAVATWAGGAVVLLPHFWIMIAK